MKFPAVLAVAAIVVAVALPSEAEAHVLKHHTSFSKMSLAQIERYQERTIEHDHHTIGFWNRHLCTRFVGGPIPSAVKLLTTGAQCATRARDLHFHRAQLRWTRRELAKTRRRIQVAKQRRAVYYGSTAAGGHNAFWNCVHDREGPWNAQTGNGYYGGLQMTYGWEGLVGNAALLSPGQQIAAAEEGFRRSGYSVSWLLGQWPNTAPPCLYLL